MFVGKIGEIHKGPQIRHGRNIAYPEVKKIKLSISLVT